MSILWQDYAREIVAKAIEEENILQSPEAITAALALIRLDWEWRKHHGNNTKTKVSQR